MTNAKPATLRDVALVFFNNWSVIATVLMVSVVVAALYCLFASPVYRAETRILVKMGRQKTSAIRDAPNESYNILFQERAQNINNELEILKGPFLVEYVLPGLKTELARRSAAGPQGVFAQLKTFASNLLNRLKSLAKAPFVYVGLIEDLTEDEELRLLFDGAFNAEHLEDTDVILLSLEWPEPEFAAFAANAYANAYLGQHVAAYESETSHGFYVEQIQSLEGQLASTEDALRQFLDEGEISNLDLQKELLLKEVSELEARLHDARVGNRETILKIGEVESMRDDDANWIETPNVGRLGVEMTDLRQLDEEFFDLKAERNELIENFMPESTEIQSLDRRLERVRAQKASSLIRILEVERDSLVSRIDFLKQEIAGAKGRLAALNTKTLELEQLRRSKDMLRDFYLLYSSKAEELRISDDLNKRQILSVTVISPAVAPVAPVRPKKMMILAVSGFLGLFIGFGYSTIREYFDHSFRNSEHIASYLNAPLLMDVPDLAEERFDSVRHWIARRGGKTGAALESEEVTGGPWSLLALESFYDELYKAKLALERRRPGESLAVAFSSCNHGEGTSTIATNFAVAANKNGQSKVLLVDANLRSPVSHHMLGVNRAPGLYDVLEGNLTSEDAVRFVESKGISVMTAGGVTENPSILFSSKAFAEFLDSLKGSYDLIVFDTAPLIPYPETPLIASKTDALVLVVQADETKWEVGEFARAALEDANAELAGAIMNRKSYPIPEPVYRLL